jgi:acyl-CoA reductase-like NAD-dependent aldehyde dehydrogenase
MSGADGVGRCHTQPLGRPFGGVKGSAYGRELGPEGLDSHLDAKSIAVAP